MTVTMWIFQHHGKKGKLNFQYEICFEWFQRASGEFLKNNVMVVDTSDYISLPYLAKNSQIEAYLERKMRKIN